MRLLRDRPPGLGEEVGAVRGSGQDVHCVVDEQRVLQVLIARLRRSRDKRRCVKIGSLHPANHSTRPRYATESGTVSGDGEEDVEGMW